MLDHLISKETVVDSCGFRGFETLARSFILICFTSNMQRQKAHFLCWKVKQMLLFFHNSKLLKILDAMLLLSRCLDACGASEWFEIGIPAGVLFSHVPGIGRGQHASQNHIFCFMVSRFNPTRCHQMIHFWRDQTMQIYCKFWLGVIFSENICVAPPGGASVSTSTLNFSALVKSRGDLGEIYLLPLLGERIHFAW